MLKVFFTGIFLVNLLFSIETEHIELPNSDKTVYENDNSTNTTKKEKYNAYVDPEIDKLWKRFLEEKEKLRQKQPPSLEIDAVTESLHNTTGSDDFNLTDIEGETASHNNDTLEPITEILVNGSDSAFGDTRRQMETIGDNIRTHAPAKYERLREPYWKGGDYVFLRTASPTTYKDVYGTEVNPIAIFRDCDRSCIRYFVSYGPVCGHRFNTMIWKNEYKDFTNICEIDEANCIDPHTIWHPMHRGRCNELKPFPYFTHYDAGEIVERKKKLHPYVYVPPTATPSTAEPDDLLQDDSFIESLT